MHLLVLLVKMVKARHGTATHVIVMGFAIFLNIMVSGMVMMEGVRILSALTTGKSRSDKDVSKTKHLVRYLV